MAFALLWWILTEGAPASWVVGVPVVLLAAWLSQRIWADRPLSALGVARFAPWFLAHSIIGAVDVAYRAVHPRMPLHPGVVRCRLTVPEGACRVALADVVSVLAGTLSVDIEGDELVIHALDVRHDMQAMVTDLEPRVAAIFGLQPAPERGA